MTKYEPSLVISHQLIKLVIQLRLNSILESSFRLLPDMNEGYYTISRKRNNSTPPIERFETFLCAWNKFLLPNTPSDMIYSTMVYKSNI